MGIVQGLTEFLPISSSGHLIIVPFLFGWADPFITSLAFSVMLHIGTLAGAAGLLPGGLVPARSGRLRGNPRPIVPGRPGPAAGVAAGGRHDPGGDRRFPAQRPDRDGFRDVGLVALTLVRGAVILWLADRWGGRTKGVDDVTFPIAGRDRRRPGAGTHPGHQPVGHQRSRRPGSPGSTARPRHASPS